MNGTRSEQRYAAVPCDTHYSPSGEALLALPGSDDIAVVRRDVALVIDQCGPPRTIEEHAAHLATVGAPAGPGALRAILETLVEVGLVEPFEPPGRPRSEPPIEFVTIPTCDRPALLARSLASWVSHCETSGHAPTFVVIDGSRSAASVAATEAAVRAVAPPARGRVVYLGPGERRTMRDVSRRADVDPDVIDWLLPDAPQEYGAGSTRNVALLATAGARFLTVDDDTVASARCHPERQEGLALVGHVDPRDSVWFTSREEAVAAGVSDDVDLLAAHAATLGQPLAASVSDSAVDLKGACKHLLRAVRGEDQGRVRMTWLGIAGDGATYCRHRVLFAGGPQRDRLASDETQFERALTSREVLRAVRRATVTDEASLMLYCAAGDNTSVLPPCQPTGFNEDGLFGWVLRATDPQAFIAQLPHAIVHDSLRPSRHDDLRILSASEVRMTEVVQSLCRSWAASCVAETVEARMASLARYLGELAGMSPRGFRHHVAKVVADAKWQWVLRCEALPREGFTYPPYWLRALTEYRRVLIESLSEPGFYVPIECRRSDVEDGLERFRRHLWMYSRALDAWPSLWSFWRDTGELTSRRRCNQTQRSTL